MISVSTNRKIRTDLATVVDKLTRVPIARTVRFLILPLLLTAVIVLFEYEIHRHSSIAAIVDSSYSAYVTECSIFIVSASIYLLYNLNPLGLNLPDITKLYAFIILGFVYFKCLMPNQLYFFAVEFYIPLKIISSEIIVYSIPQSHLYIAFTLFQSATDLHTLLHIQNYEFDTESESAVCLATLCVILIVVLYNTRGIFAFKKKHQGHHGYLHETGHCKKVLLPLSLLILASVLDFFIDDISQMQLIQSIGEKTGKDLSKFDHVTFIIKLATIFQICSNFISGFSFTLLLDLEVKNKKRRELLYILLQAVAFLVGGISVWYIMGHRQDIAPNFRYFLLSKMFTASISTLVAADLVKLNSNHYNVVRCAEEIFKHSVELALNNYEDEVGRKLGIPLAVGIGGSVITLLSWFSNR
ncbi:MAG: hypothetical protein MHMPM18_001128 [Marteilia pararefringens]